MKNNAIKLLVLAFFAFLLSSCLTVEKKEYKWEFTGDNSGKLTITYINIMSDMDDSLDVSQEDFEELLNSYVNGTYIDENYPLASNIEKRLYARDGQLWGEVVVEFDNLEAVHIYKRDKKGPYMFCVNTTADAESFVESNGDYGGEYMPVVFWESKSKELILSTLVQEPDETTLSLLDEYNKWKE